MLLGHIFPHSFNQYLLTGHLLPGGPLLGSEQTSDPEPWLSPHRPPSVYCGWQISGQREHSVAQMMRSCRRQPWSPEGGAHLGEAAPWRPQMAH